MARAILVLLCCAGLARAAARDTNWVVQFLSPDVEYDLETRDLIVTNGIVIKYGGATLSARKAIANEVTGLVQAEGDVYIEREGHVWRSERMRYNFYTGEVLGADFRTGQTPFFAEGKVLAGDHKAGVYVGREGSVTTDDYAGRAGYRVRAKNIIIVPGEYLEASHAILYLGKVPVFYFPYYRRSLKDQANHISFTPGYRSQDGPYLLTSYNWYWDQRLEGVVHVDGRVERGVGFGPDFKWNLPKFGDGSLKSYYIHDLDPNSDSDTDEDIPNDRYRFWAGHQIDLRTNLTAKGLVRYQSDRFITRDFFESEYRENVQPSTFVEVNQRWSNFTLDVLVQPRVNDFFETVERLPDIKLTGLRQQIGPTPLYYESDSSVGYFRRKFIEGDTNYAAIRADTFHQVLLPQTFFGWLTVTPRVGGRFTHYGEAHLEGGVTDEENRGVFNTGAEASFKVSRLWREPRSKLFQVDGIRHILQPSVNYVYVPRPNVHPRDLPQFDYTVPTTRLLPIDFPDFNAIDSIDSQNAVRLGLRNKLQTKRGARGIDNLLNWALYTDWRLDPNEQQANFSDVFSDADLRPFHWLTLSSEIRYDVNDSILREANHLITLTPNDVWSWQFGHRYLESLPGSDPSLSDPESGNNTLFHSLYFRLNENWATRISHRFEARDGVLEEQLYTVYRDFRSWTGALSVRIRDRREGATDFTIAATFSLKAFPRFEVGDDINRPLLLLGH